MSQLLNKVKSAQKFKKLKKFIYGEKSYLVTNTYKSYYLGQIEIDFLYNPSLDNWVIGPFISFVKAKESLTTLKVNSYTSSQLEKLVESKYSTSKMGYATPIIDGEVLTMYYDEDWVRILRTTFEHYLTEVPSWLKGKETQSFILNFDYDYDGYLFRIVKKERLVKISITKAENDYPIVNDAFDLNDESSLDVFIYYYLLLIKNFLRYKSEVKEKFPREPFDILFRGVKR